MKADAVCLMVNMDQVIELVPVESSSTRVGLEEIGYWVHNPKQLRNFLISRRMKPRKMAKSLRGWDYFEVQDTEGNLALFTSRVVDGDMLVSNIASEMIHAGFVVKDLTAENRFYFDLLGFRLYWQGGFKDDQTDWVEMQVPDGTDWIEYMLNIPVDADRKELGIQNHFSFGVEDIHATADKLRKNGITNFDGPEIGRDGKWSLDAYDPDGTRVEFMEFRPAQPPCCHPYTAEHPKL